MGPATVAPHLQGLRAQAPSPSFTEGTHAVSKLCNLTERSLEHNRDGLFAATRRCAPAQQLRPVDRAAARRVRDWAGGNETTPTFNIKGKIIVNFDQAKLNAALGIR